MTRKEKKIEKVMYTFFFDHLFETGDKKMFNKLKKHLKKNLDFEVTLTEGIIPKNLFTREVILEKTGHQTKKEKEESWFGGQICFQKNKKDICMTFQVMTQGQTEDLIG